MPRVASEDVRAAIRSLFVSHGLSEFHAGDVADTLVETSLAGVDTHGVRLLPTYVREIENGRANPSPNFRVAGELPAIGVFDADHALGVVAANAAMREAISRASLCGISALAVANSNHFGAAGYYARMAARQDKIGLVFSNSDALVTPYGGISPLNGTNPLAMAAPGLEDEGFFLDMATSQIAYSKVMHALAQGQPPPMPSVHMHAGIPTVPPLGGYKGQGLGTMVQILCALLADMPLDADLTHLYEPPYDAPRRVSHFMVVIDVRAFVDPPTFKTRLSELLRRFRTSPAAAESDGVVNAGDPERLVRSERLRDGIPLGTVEAEFLEPFLASRSLERA